MKEKCLMSKPCCGVFKAVHATRDLFAWSQVFVFTGYLVAQLLHFWPSHCQVTSFVQTYLLSQSQYSVNNSFVCVCVCVCCCIPFAQIIRWNADHMNADEKNIFLISNKYLEDSLYLSWVLHVHVCKNEHINERKVYWTSPSAHVKQGGGGWGDILCA